MEDSKKIDNFQSFAEALDLASQELQPISLLSKRNSLMSDDAYAIQNASVDLRFERGEDFIGIKMIGTSQLDSTLWGSGQIGFGKLTDRMLIRNETRIKMKKLIAPKVTADLCFLVKKSIDKKIEVGQLSEFIGAVTPTIQVWDSRYTEDPTFHDLIADNAGAAAIVLGTWFPMGHDPIHDLKIELMINQQVLDKQMSDVLNGDPWKSVLAATEFIEKHNLFLPEGSFILSGAMTKPLPIKRHQIVELKVDGTIEVMVNVE